VPNACRPDRERPVRGYRREMAQRPRLEVPGGFFHITSRGNRGQPIFLVLGDYHHFLELLVKTTKAAEWPVFAYCLMTNHYHLLVQTQLPNLSQTMQRLNSTYAHWFNRRHGMEGHLFRNRFYSGLVDSEWHLLAAARYIVLNPVRARLCHAPQDWRWSSYAETLAGGITGMIARERLLSYFGTAEDDGRAGYREFVREGVALGRATAAA
jgi:REP element-mobilizing transposase RayT